MVAADVLVEERRDGEAARADLAVADEEPAPEALFLRFTYEWADDGKDSELDAMTLELRKQAYVSADLDTVSRIRELAQAGLLD